MTNSPLAPEFSDPPVTELAFSLQFAPLPSLKTAHLALWWQELKSDYPKIEEQAPLPPVVEQFGVAPSPPNVQIILSGPGVGGQQRPWPGSRYWFIAETGDRLIQVQTDRLMYNWRRVEGSQAIYPKYGKVRESFLETLRHFRLFLRKGGFGELEPNQCELTYVNHLTMGKGWNKFAEMGNVFAVCLPSPPGGLLPEAEDASFQFRYLIQGKSGEPSGRLYVTVQPAARATDGALILVLQIVARGRSEAGTDESILSFLDRGHDLAIRAFMTVTAEKMHQIWGQRDAN